jgi:predicted O-methyltransferase YrrM
MISFLEAKKFEGRQVLEFGAGYSTLWWASRAQRVVSFEANREWFEKLQNIAPANVTLTHVPSKKPALEDITRHGEQYDIIIIDGLHRPHCAAFTPDLLAQNGAIIIDNSEGYGMTIGESITTMFGAEFSRVDFYGYCPGVIRRHCTSLLFRGNAFLLEGKEPPMRFA